MKAENTTEEGAFCSGTCTHSNTDAGSEEGQTEVERAAGYSAVLGVKHLSTNISGRKELLK